MSRHETPRFHRADSKTTPATDDDRRTEADRLAEYEYLTANGLSDGEARATAWPDRGLRPKEGNGDG